MIVSFVPGPSHVYPKLPQYLEEAVADGVLSMSHRSQDFADIYARTSADLRKLLEIPDDYHIWFMGSATEAMERILQNLVLKRSHHFVNGAFSTKFETIARDLGISTSTTQVPLGTGFDLLDYDIPGDAELVAITHNETSTGASIDIDEIRELRLRYPDMLIAVDVVSSVPFVRLDFTSVDCAFFSVQKGFGLPAGLGVLVASPRALKRAEDHKLLGRSIGSYHSFTELAAHEAKNNTPETPNVLGIYLLGRVASDMLQRGAEQMREEIAHNSDVLRALIDDHPLLSHAVTVKRHRSPTVIVAKVAGGSAPLIEDVKRRGFEIGAGYAGTKDTHIRIANFPAHAEHIASLINEISSYRGV